MGFSIGSLIEATVLFLNAMAIINADRVLKKCNYFLNNF